MRADGAHPPHRCAAAATPRAASCTPWGGAPRLSVPPHLLTGTPGTPRPGVCTADLTVATNYELECEWQVDIEMGDEPEVLEPST